jgi:hypothetical protein
MPTPTDLVTDLPADFEVFGQAVDTSLADLKGGTSGQVLAKNSNTDMDFVWVAQDDSNAIQNAIVDAKGDLIGATAADTPARLAVGANNTFLQANSSTATGLEWVGSYTSYTPTSGGNWTLGNGTVSGRFLQVGKLVSFFGSFVLGSTSTVTGGMFITLPVAADSVNNGGYIGLAKMTDTGVTNYQGVLVQNDTLNLLVILSDSSTTYLTENFFASNRPFTWGTGDQVFFSGSYVAA